MRRKKTLCGSGGQTQAGPGWERDLWQSREGHLNQEGWRYCKNPKEKSPPGGRPMSGGRRSKAGELLPEPVRGDGCREANQHAGARSPSAVVVPERPVWKGGEGGAGPGGQELSHALRARISCSPSGSQRCGAQTVPAAWRPTPAGSPSPLGRTVGLAPPRPAWSLLAPPLLGWLRPACAAERSRPRSVLR